MLGEYVALDHGCCLGQLERGGKLACKWISRRSKVEGGINTIEYTIEPIKTMPIDTRRYGAYTPFTFGAAEDDGAIGRAARSGRAAFLLIRGFGFKTKAGLDAGLFGNFEVVA